MIAQRGSTTWLLFLLCSIAVGSDASGTNFRSPHDGNDPEAASNNAQSRRLQTVTRARPRRPDYIRRPTPYAASNSDSNDGDGGGDDGGDNGGDGGDDGDDGDDDTDTFWIEMGPANQEYVDFYLSDEFMTDDDEFQMTDDGGYVGIYLMQPVSPATEDVTCDSEGCSGTIEMTLSDYENIGFMYSFDGGELHIDAGDSIYFYFVALLESCSLPYLRLSGLDDGVEEPTVVGTGVDQVEYSAGLSFMELGSPENQGHCEISMEMFLRATPPDPFSDVSISSVSWKLPLDSDYVPSGTQEYTMDIDASGVVAGEGDAYAVLTLVDSDDSMDDGSDNDSMDNDNMDSNDSQQTGNGPPRFTGIHRSRYQLISLPDSNEVSSGSSAQHRYQGIHRYTVYASSGTVVRTEP